MQSTDQPIEAAVDAEVPQELRQAVVSLVSAKELADRLAQGNRVERELARKCDLPHGEDGTSFFREIFPFCGHWEPSGPSAIRRVPLELTVGHSWRWQPEHVDPQDRASLVERLLSCTDGLERAEVCWIVPLGLFLAHEGKNRVAFLRSEGATHFPALTTPYDYPAAGRLQLIQASGPHGDEWWAVLDHDAIEPLHYPGWVQPVLTAYGVRTVHGWPTAFPSYAAVKKEIAYRDRHQGPRSLALPPVFLTTLLSREERAAEAVSASFMDLRDVRLKRPWKLGLIALVGAFLVGVLVVQPSLGEFSLLSACLGALLLLAVMLFAETLTAPRRQIVSEGR